MIKDFSRFDNILYAFDLDNTLVQNVKFEDEIKVYLKENNSLKNYLYSELDKINIDINDLKYENGRVFLNDPNKNINISNNSLWVRKKDRIYITTPNSFYTQTYGEPTNVNTNIVELYNKSTYKTIITIRNNIYRSQTVKLLDKLNISQPNKGLFMYPNSKIINKSIWKSNKLIDLYESFNNINYFDDDIKLLKRMKKELTNYDIKLYHVRNNNYRII